MLIAAQKHDPIMINVENSCAVFIEMAIKKNPGFFDGWKFKWCLVEMVLFYNINVVTVTFDQFNASQLWNCSVVTIYVFISIFNVTSCSLIQLLTPQSIIFLK